jgi:carbonic anhydrase/acetyltransferase-like protein (isoleucine patch superfamily)
MWWGKKEVVIVPEASTEGKKYKLGDKVSVCAGNNLVYEVSRIIALRDIPRHGITAGQIGGYVGSEFNLAQEGDAWVGKDAIVHGHVKVKDNALVTDNSSVISNQISDKPYPWVGGAAIIKDNATLAGVDFIAQGNSQVMDSSSVFDSKISGSVTISDDAIVENSTVKKRVTISGSAHIVQVLAIDDAVIKDSAYMFAGAISGQSSIGGSCRIENSKLREETHVSGNVKIKDNSICEGTNYLSGDLVIPPNHYVVNKTMVGEKSSFFGLLKTDDDPADSDGTEASPAVNGLTYSEKKPAAINFEALITGIENEYRSYSTDIVKLIKYPLMTDPSVPQIQDFLFLLRKAKRLISSPDEVEQKDVSEQLERAYMVAESHALKVASSQYSEIELKKTEDAKNFINKACDENSTVAEKKIGFRATMKALEGVVTVPEDAVDAFRERIGLLEIEA